jgi:fructose-1,6-bisphosphatase/inositol monophosphatase family enzyme
LPSTAISQFPADPNQVDQIIRSVAASEVMSRFRNLKANEISEKSPKNYVTRADIEAEKRLAEDLTRLIPGSVAIGEESVEDDPNLLNLLNNEAPVWILDPVDGTGNFVAGKACFALIVAYFVAGETIAGWIHDPIHDITVSAIKGKGAWIGSTRLKTPDKMQVEEMTGSLGPRFCQKVRDAFGYSEEDNRLVRYKCVGMEYLDLARGILHFARYAGRIKPWDHAAGILIHDEAGGHNQLSGEVAGNYDATAGIIENSSLLLAPNLHAWGKLQAIIGEP